MLSLLGDGSDVASTSGGIFLACGTGLHTTVAAVVAHAIAAVVVVYSCVVNVAIARDVYVAYRLIVVKVAIVPAAAFVAVATVAIAVINAAVETDFRPPVAFVENVAIAIAAPVAGSPEIADLGSHHPRSRDPIIVVVTVSPVTGGPDVAVPGGDGLIINGQFGRGDPDGYTKANLGRGCRRDGQQYEREQQRTKR